MRPGGYDRVSQSLERLHGQIAALGAALDDNAQALGRLGERVAQLEQGVQATKDVVEAFTAAKSSMRFLKWLAGLIAALAALAAALKGWLHR
ncbi:MAG: hypothetical protein J0I80_11870 [Sphingomonas sp.]|nr:hypothetical protein [Sphingomonas sp.]